MFKIYGKPNCIFCEKAVSCLKSLDLSYEYIDLSVDVNSLQRIKSEGHKTVPVIFFNEGLIGGYTELEEYLK